VAKPNSSAPSKAIATSRPVLTVRRTPILHDFLSHLISRFVVPRLNQVPMELPVC
jgi:hypothetical protein